MSEFVKGMDEEEKEDYEEFIELLKENNLGEVELTRRVGEIAHTVIFRAKKWTKNSTE